MPIVSKKRQITLPLKQCEEAGIKPGDEYQCFVADGRITVVKKRVAAAKGILRHIKGDSSISDRESMAGSILAQQ